jgi:hypothetical protein
VAEVCIIPEDDELDCNFVEVDNLAQIKKILKGTPKEISVNWTTGMYILEDASSKMPINDRATRLLLVASEKPAQLIYGPALVFGVNLDGTLGNLRGSAIGYLSDMRLMDIMLPVPQV